MRRILLSLPLLLLSLFFALPALAGNWGENWGTMVWGSVAAVPTMGWLGGGLLVGLLASLGMRRSRRGSTGLVLLLALAYAPVAEAQVSVPNIFTDGTPALASEVNEHFQALASAVNASDCATAADVVCNPSAVSCPACPSCPDCGSSDFFDQGFNTGAASVDITSDNAAVCTTAGGTYDAGADSCSVDITTDNAAIAAVAGHVACTQAGGTWEAGTSTCTPAPAASSYNCFVGGFCAQAAIEFPPGDFNYPNVYEGHTPGTEPALGAGCNLPPFSVLGVNVLWGEGSFVLTTAGSSPNFSLTDACGQ